MDSPIPPDPYAALGVSKDADATTIKSTYRKLALKCHPDKVTDESLKKQKQDEFHKIQSAYEIIGDEDKRATYDAQIRLAELRKEKMERSGGTPSRSATYDYRSPASHSTPRYEERKPTRAYDDDMYFDDRSSSRKHDAFPKRPAPRSSRTDREPIRVSRTTDKVKSDHKKTKDKEERRDRSAKFSYAEDDESPDEKARYEREYRKRSEEARLREAQEADAERARKDAAEARRKADEQRRYTEETAARARRSTSRDREDRFSDERQRKLSDLENNVKNYISTSRSTESRPQTSRAASSRDTREYYDVRPRRPEAPRRSSARPRERETAQPVSSSRDGHRKISLFPEIVEWGEEDRKPPTFKHSVSSPADIKTVPRVTPQRSSTVESSHERRRETSPTPIFRRSETMPSVQASTRRKETTPTRSSTLRNENILPSESRHSSPEVGYPSVPSAQAGGATKKYYYATPGGGVTLAPEDLGLSGSHRTVLREPEARRRQRSPSPLAGTRTVPAPASSSRHPAASPRVVTGRIPPPPMGRSATMSVSPERRPSLDERRPSLYGEVESDYLRRERARKQTSFPPDQINWAKKYGPEHVEWSRSGDKERDYPKPSLRRHETYAY